MAYKLIYLDFDGIEARRLENAKLYIGKPNEDATKSGVTVYLDKDLTIFAKLPLRIKNGWIYHSGNLVNIYTDVPDVSLALYDMYDNVLLMLPSVSLLRLCD